MLNSTKLRDRVTAFLSTDEGKTMRYTEAARALGCSHTTVAKCYHELFGPKRYPRRSIGVGRDSGKQQQMEEHFPEEPGDFVDMGSHDEPKHDLNDNSPRVERMKRLIRADAIARMRDGVEEDEIEKEDPED